MINLNFRVKWTLNEANTVRAALQRRLKELMQTPIPNMTSEEKCEADTIDDLLRRDF